GRRQPGLGGAAQGPGGCPELLAAPAAGLRGTGNSPMAVPAPDARAAGWCRSPAPRGACGRGRAPGRIGPPACCLGLTSIIAAMPTYLTDAIVLRRLDYGEPDRILTLL